MASGELVVEYCVKMCTLFWSSLMLVRVTSVAPESKCLGLVRRWAKMPPMTYKTYSRFLTFATHPPWLCRVKNVKQTMGRSESS